MIGEGECFRTPEALIDGMGRVETTHDYEVFMRAVAKYRSSNELISKVRHFMRAEAYLWALNDTI